MNPQEYLDSKNLWDLELLKLHAQNNSVYVIESKRFPDLVMLHYMDACAYDNKWTEFSRMSRGLILDMRHRKVLAYPFDKFFNLGQMPETSYDSLLSLGSFETVEKLDGSMCTLFKDPNTDKLTFTTKGSFDSEHGLYANNLEMSKEFWAVAETYASAGTLVFELVTKRFQIVIDYAKKGYKEGLYLIGYRRNFSNEFASPLALTGMAEELGIPTFKTYQFGSLDNLIDAAKTLPVLEEGFVLRFSGDLLVKVKGYAYLEMHRFISHLSDRNILQAVANNTADDLAKLCPDEFKDEVMMKIAAFKERCRELSEICYTKYTEGPKENRKEFAAWVNQNVDRPLRGFVFQLMDGKELDQKRIYKTIEEIDHIDGRTKI